MTATTGWPTTFGTSADERRALGPSGPVETPDHPLFQVRPSSWIQSFFEVPAEAAVKLEAAAVKRSFRRGEAILRKDERPEGIYMIDRGQVKLLLGAKGRVDLLIAVLGEGEYFGESPLLDGRPWPISAVAMEPTDAFFLKKDVVLSLMATSPELASEFLFNVADRLRDSYEMIQDAIFLDVAGRLAKKLLDLGRDYGRATPEGVVIDLGLTQQDLGRMVGVTRESVNKHIGAFRARGLVEMRDRRIVILRPDELKRRIY